MLLGTTENSQKIKKCDSYLWIRDLFYKPFLKRHEGNCDKSYLIYCD